MDTIESASSSPKKVVISKSTAITVDEQQNMGIAQSTVQTVAKARVAPTGPLLRERERWSFLDVLAGIVLSRVLLVAIAESEILSIKTVQHVFVIFIPLQITIHQFGLYPAFQWKWLRLLYLVVHVCCLFGLGFAVPAVFASTKDTLSNFTFFLCFSRFVFSLQSILRAFLDIRHWNLEFFNACFSALPLLAWIFCFFQTTQTQFYSLYLVGMAVDVCSIVLMDMAQGRQLRYVPLSQAAVNWISADLARSSCAFFGAALWYFFQSRVFAEYPDENASIQFDAVNYLYGSVAVLLLSCLSYTYHDASRTWSMFSTASPQHLFLRLVVFKWIHYILNVSYCVVASSLSLILFDLYSPLPMVPRFPVNLNKFPTVQLTVTGNDYFSLAAAQSGIIPETKSYLHVPLFIGSLGVWIVCFSALDFLGRIESDHWHPKQKLVYLSGVLVGLVLLIVGCLPLSWSSTNLVIPLVTVSGSVSIMTLLLQILS
ncbi:hypothetical protein HDU91_005923 [Kappamyces sp. JEL0680]|nr:hypothetical protein HDU91_005923 [Kappamyces sp. JEL0680]